MHAGKLFAFGLLTGLLLFPLGLVIIDKVQSFKQPPDAETLLREKYQTYLRAFRNAAADTIRLPLDFVKSTSKTDEERLAELMNQVGPLIAISETDGRKTDFGAARLSINHDEWKGTVLRRMSIAPLIVLRIDPVTEKWARFYKDTLRYDLKGSRLILKDSLEPNAEWRPKAFLLRTGLLAG